MSWNRTQNQSRYVPRNRNCENVFERHLFTFLGDLQLTLQSIIEAFHSSVAVLARDENGSDTDGYHSYRICFHIYVRIRIRIRIVSKTTSFTNIEGVYIIEAFHSSVAVLANSACMRRPVGKSSEAIDPTLLHRPKKVMNKRTIGAAAAFRICPTIGESENFCA
jgi:hypothetical protein